MGRVTSLSLGEPMQEFIDRMIDTGRYNSASEVMRTALRLLEEKENEQAALRKALQAGLDSGISSLTHKEIIELRRKKMGV